MDKPELADVDSYPFDLTPGFDQLAAYRRAAKLGGTPEQEIASLRERIEQKQTDIRELLDFAGPAGSNGAAKLADEITAMEEEIALQEAVLRGERLSERELERLARTKVDRSPRSRRSGLTL